MNELRAELVSLERLKEKIAARVAAIDAVLTPLVFEQSALPFIAGPEIPLVEDDVPPQTHGLRAAALEVLKTHGPLRAPDIAVVLEKAGFSDGGTTPLATRVYNDLWRLSEKGLLRKDGSVFALPEEG